MGSPLVVELRAGRLHVPASTYEQALQGCPAVALLERDHAWWLIPLAAGAGGLQLKLRTARGDRVVEAQEFFRAQGLEDTHEPRTLGLEFEPSRGAFKLVPPAPYQGG
ncbi:MAG: hypothetical protein ACOZJZ_23345 [Pseudomonadota bacterium]|jgi:hypothetical protein